MTTTTPACPKCGRRQVRYRRRTQDYACDSCPWIGQLATPPPATRRAGKRSETP